MTPRPSPDDASRAAEIAFQSGYQIGLCCEVTGHPVGTDTWALGSSCVCPNCQAMVRLADLILTFAAQAAQRAEEECAVKAEEHCRYITRLCSPKHEEVCPACTIAASLRARHAATPEPPDPPPPPLDGFTPNLQR